MVATPTVNGTTVPTFGVNVLHTVLAEMEAAHPEYGQRPIRAASIVAGRRIEETPRGSYWV